MGCVNSFMGLMQHCHAGGVANAVSVARTVGSLVQSANLVPLPAGWDGHDGAGYSRHWQEAVHAPAERAILRQIMGSGNRNVVLPGLHGRGPTTHAPVTNCSIDNTEDILTWIVGDEYTIRGTDRTFFELSAYVTAIWGAQDSGSDRIECTTGAVAQLNGMYVAHFAAMCGVPSVDLLAVTRVLVRRFAAEAATAGVTLTHCDINGRREPIRTFDDAPLFRTGEELLVGIYGQGDPMREEVELAHIVLPADGRPSVTVTLWSPRLLTEGLLRLLGVPTLVSDDPQQWMDPMVQDFTTTPPPPRVESAVDGSDRFRLLELD